MCQLSLTNPRDALHHKRSSLTTCTLGMHFCITTSVYSIKSSNYTVKFHKLLTATGLLWEICCKIQRPIQDQLTRDRWQINCHGAAASATFKCSQVYIKLKCKIPQLVDGDWVSTRNLLSNSASHPSPSNPCTSTRMQCSQFQIGQ